MQGLDGLQLTPGNPPNDGIRFVDHRPDDRSGHLGHALVELEPGCITAWYPNCSADHDGHSAVGWMEYRRSTDGGRSWEEARPFPYSKDVFDADDGRSVMTENAVRTPDGQILAMNLECDVSENALWRPYGVPTYLLSDDGGKHWGPVQSLGAARGRVYDVIVDDSEIFALELENDATDTWYGTEPDHRYALYVSGNAGSSFSRRSTLPFETDRRGYGALQILGDGTLAAYVYQLDDEHHLEYTISADGGTTWDDVGTVALAKKIRNPQITAFKDRYILHGRSGSYGYASGNLVLYTSPDGLNWNDGTYLRMQTAGSGAYSNNLVVGSGEDARLLLQASHAYEASKTNIIHWWLE